MNHHLITLLNLLRILEHYIPPKRAKLPPPKYIPISPFDKQKPEITAFSMKRPYGQK